MAHLREKKGNYYAEFYDPQREPKRKWVTLRTRDKSAAQSRLREFQHQYAAGTYDPWQDPADTAIALKDAHDKFLEVKNHLSEATIDKYDLVIRQLRDATSDHTALRSIRPDDLEAVYLRDSLSDYSKYTYYRHLHVFVKWALDEGYLKNDPLAAARTPKQVKRDKTFLMPKDVEELLSRIETAVHVEGRDVQWLHDMVRVAITTGLRVSELVHMKWSWVNLEGGRLTIRTDEFSSKSGHEESVPLVADAVDVLRRRKSEHDNEYVFSTKRTDQLSRMYVSERFKQFVRLAELDERISFHSLRHTCASWMVMRGVPLRVVQKVLRHSTISVTEGYAHLGPDVVRSHMKEAFAGENSGDKSNPEKIHEEAENSKSM